MGIFCSMGIEFDSLQDEKVLDSFVQECAYN